MTAVELLEELIQSVRPPRHIAIRLTERPAEPNWVASVGSIDAVQTLAFVAKVTELRVTNPIVDWKNTTQLFGSFRTVAGWATNHDRRRV